MGRRRWVLVLALGLTGCAAIRPIAPPGRSTDVGAPTAPIASVSPVDLPPGDRLRVVATTSLVADVLRVVGAGQIEITQLVPTGADPHGYLATPRDLQRASEAQAIFANGFGLEEALTKDLEQAAPGVIRLSISEGILPRRLAADDPGGAGGGSSQGEGVDPHVWMDPLLVQTWTINAAQALGGLDPAHAGEYRANAQEYLRTLEDLDRWITTRVAEVPSRERLLVTDHLVFGYFADRYQFEMIGAVIPAFSTQAEPSAQELARLEDLIAARGVRAVFVSAIANPAQALRVSEDLGVPLVPLYTSSLSDPQGPASTYQEFMEYDVNAIVDALR